MSLSRSSIGKLQTCHKEIQDVVLELEIRRAKRGLTSIQVIEGSRTLERQRQLIKEGKSSLKKAENGKHVKTPSDAVDIAPLTSDGKIEWNNTKAFVEMADEFLEIAKEKNYKIRWGGDWNRNGDWKDEHFPDMVHFERDY